MRRLFWRLGLTQCAGRCEPSPARFEELAGYNTRKYNGIAHDPEYVARMAVLQAGFDAWIRESNARRGHEMLAPPTGEDR